MRFFGFLLLHLTTCSFFTFSLSTLMALIKESPPNILRPHLAQLMSSLLDALTWTEHEKINYLSVRAGADEREQVCELLLSTCILGGGR